MKSKSNQTISIFVLIVFTTLACGQFSIGILTPTPDVTQTYTLALTTFPSHTPYITLTPWITPTPRITLTDKPFVTKTPNSIWDMPNLAAKSTRINFLPGRTYFFSDDYQFAANGTQYYILGVMEGQEMSIGVVPNTGTNGNDFWLTIYGVDDGTLMVQNANSFWQGTVPATQDYLVIVANRGEAISGSIQIQIPFKITFESGSPASTVIGVMEGQGVNMYTVHAEAGQTFTVTVNSPNEDAVLTVVGEIDGTPYCRSQMLETYCAITGRVNQDYSIMVTSKAVIVGTETPSTPINYTLEIAFSD